MRQIRIELQVKIGPFMDVLYTMFVVVMGYFFIVPYLPGAIGVLVTMILLLSGLRLSGTSKGAAVRSSLVKLLKMVVEALD